MNPIFKRKSIRKFKNKEISLEQIKRLLEAGMQAPSACNQQAWEFIIISDDEDKIAISKMHQFAAPARNASKLIVTLGNLKEAKLEAMLQQDLGACNENILLQSVCEGLGAVWLGFWPIEERCQKLKEYLSIPDYCIPFSVICIGYSDENEKIQNRFDHTKIHIGKY